MAQELLDAANRGRESRGEEPLYFGLGLRIGEILFGNIGVPQRGRTYPDASAL